MKSYWINKDLLTKIVSRFLVSDKAREPMAFTLHDRVSLVSDADDLVKESTIKVSGNLNPGGTGWIECLVVPAGKRWHFKAYQIIAGANETVDQIRVNDGTNVCRLESFTSTNERGHVFNQSIKLEPGWGIELNLDAQGVSDLVALNVVVEEQDI